MVNTVIVGYRNATVAMMKAIWLKGYTLLLTRHKFIAKIEKDTFFSGNQSVLPGVWPLKCLCQCMCLYTVLS